MMGMAMAARMAQRRKACHSHSQSWRESARGCSRAPWRRFLAERGMGAVWKTRLAARMKGMTKMSSSG